MRIHFIGIGGIGMSAIARFLLNDGHIVSGSDIAKNEVTKGLEKLAVKINIPHNKKYITDDIDLIIKSAIIKDSNEEIMEANSAGIEIISRRDALKLIMQNTKNFCVCGAHGKSTTSAILASIIKDGNALIGAISKEFNSNARITENKITVFEADESDKSFLNSNPFCSIVTNVEAEHMETYNHNIDELHDAYTKFINMATLKVINKEDPFLKNIEFSNQIDLYPSKDIRNIEYKIIDHLPHTSFNLLDYGNFEVYGLGFHVALDASLAILAAKEIMEIDEIKSNLKNYRGTKKRFDILYSDKNISIIDDYAHHPTEIAASSSSLDIYKKISNYNQATVIFQPHKYTRLKENKMEFYNALKDMGKIYILPVWSANEEKIDIDMSIFEEDPNFTFCEDIKRVEKGIVVKTKGGDINIDKGALIGFGAGDITYKLRNLA